MAPAFALSSICASLVDALVASSRGAVLLLDPAGRVQLANAAVERWWLLQGQPLAGPSLVGLPWLPLCPPALLPGLRPAVALAQAGQSTSLDALGWGITTLPVREASGATAAVLLVAHELPVHEADAANREGALQQLVHDQQDTLDSLSEQLANESHRLTLTTQRLAHAERLQLVGQFVAGVVHDLSNVMNVITNSASLIRSRGGLDAAQTRASQAIDRAMHMTTPLLRKLLDFARVGGGAATPVRLDLLIAEHAHLFGNLLGQGVALRLEATGPVWPVMADTQAVVGVLMNLLANARDAVTAGSGEVHLSVRNVSGDAADGGLVAREQVSVTVRDNGCGIAPELLPRLGREPFVTTKPAGQGTGLGLASAFDLARACGGDVRIHSAPAMGTTVTLYLPRAAG